MVFLQMLHCSRVSVFSRFRDIRPQTYRGHDLNLSGSRDVRRKKKDKRKKNKDSVMTIRLPFSSDAPLESILYLQRFSRYSVKHMLTNEHTNTQTHAYTPTNMTDRNTSIAEITTVKSDKEKIVIVEVDRKRKFYFRPKTETETESR